MNIFLLKLVEIVLCIVEWCWETLWQKSVYTSCGLAKIRAFKLYSLAPSTLDGSRINDLLQYGENSKTRERSRKDYPKQSYDHVMFWTCIRKLRPPGIQELSSAWAISVYSHMYFPTLPCLMESSKKEAAVPCEVLVTLYKTEAGHSTFGLVSRECFIQFYVWECGLWNIGRVIGYLD